MLGYLTPYPFTQLAILLVFLRSISPPGFFSPSQDSMTRAPLIPTNSSYFLLLQHKKCQTSLHCGASLLIMRTVYQTQTEKLLSSAPVSFSILE